jgi:hypothetical protein
LKIEVFKIAEPDFRLHGNDGEENDAGIHTLPMRKGKEKKVDFRKSTP